MALDLPLPKQILAHAHWTLGREKMAKSTGNVVNPFFAIDRFGVDMMRYYLAHDGRNSQDSDYSNENIIERYKKGLQGGLGNLTSRILRGKGWSVRDAVKLARDGSLGLWNGQHQEQYDLLAATPGWFAGRMNNLNVSEATQGVMKMIYAVCDVHTSSGKSVIDSICRLMYTSNGRNHGPL